MSTIKMCDSPATLEDLCLNCICDNLTEVFDWKSIVNHHARFSDNCYIKQYRLKDGEMFLFNEVSELLWLKLFEKNLLSDGTLAIFTEEHTRLRRIRLPGNRDISEDGLKVLQRHKLQEIDCAGVRHIAVNTIIDSLSPWSVENLTVLNAPQCTFIDSKRFCYMVSLMRLKNLRVLNVSRTELNQASLDMICTDMKLLERLDISGTPVKSLEPLVNLADRLTSLNVSDLREITLCACHIVKLHQLRHLDVSIVNEKYDLRYDNVVTRILDAPDCLPELVSFDMSGWKSYVVSECVQHFLDSHPKIRFLGLAVNAVAYDPMFTKPQSANYFEHITVAGMANESQLRHTLSVHHDRPFFVQKALYHLFQLTGGFKGARTDVIEVVLSAMKEHPDKFGVQVAATACLYNLTRGELSKSLHPTLLAMGVDLILTAMENFPEEYQLQKNSLLNLCSDRILQDITFNKFRCAKLVLDSLCRFEETNMNRMAVAICSILAAKVSTSETSELGARPVYMRKLLSMVQSRVDLKQSDITLKFTLSALWNLTDESAATCYVFLEQAGCPLFLSVLQTFHGDNAIETKVLGLLNNIAEVEFLRPNLMTDALVNELHHLLLSEHIDVSYFAAGIVAHLASDGDEKWAVKVFTKDDMLKQLEAAVSDWQVPDSEMVAYRSFKPFFPLLARDMDYQVQLWAVWAIFHVCNKNPKRYCAMLTEERGITLLNELNAYKKSHETIRRITSQILEIMVSDTF